LKGIWKGIQDAGSGAWKAITDAYDAFVSAVKSFVVPSAIMDFFKFLSNPFQDVKAKEGGGAGKGGVFGTPDPAIFDELANRIDAAITRAEQALVNFQATLTLSTIGVVRYVTGVGAEFAKLGGLIDSGILGALNVLVNFGRGLTITLQLVTQFVQITGTEFAKLGGLLDSAILGALNVLVNFGKGLDLTFQLVFRFTTETGNQFKKLALDIDSHVKTIIGGPFINLVRALDLMAIAFTRFATNVQTMAVTVSGAFSNMAANATLSMGRMAQGILIVIASLTKVQTDSQRMATTVSGSFSNMAANVTASMSRMASGILVVLSSFTRVASESQRMSSVVSSALSQMASRAQSFSSSFQSSMSRVSSSAASAASSVNRLASAINSLRSKSITITTTYVTRYYTVYGAKGGAFVANSPMKVGPMHISEFGQKELVTVTPLEGPGRQPLTGSNNIKTNIPVPAGRAAGAGAGGTRLLKETPIIVQIDGKEIARAVNSRLFEMSDILT
jgi:hypothetical protein